MSQIRYNSTNIARIYRFNEKLELGDTLGAYDEVLTILPEYLPETNHKIVNEIYWRTWVYNVFEFSSIDSLALYEVAVQHPHFGGTAVYDARVMLGLDFFDFVNDENKMVYETSSEEPNVQSEDDIDFVLYPNPATLNIFYKLSLRDNENASLKFYDLMGRLILEKTVNNESQEGLLDISLLSKGMYKFKIESSEMRSFTGSFIVE